MKKVAQKLPPTASPSAEIEALFERLPLRQKNLISNYLSNGFNATQAAIDAGFSAKTADSQASRLLKNVKVKRIIAERTKASLKKRDIKAEKVLDGIARLSEFDVRTMYTPEGELIPIHLLPEDTARCLTGMRFKDGMLASVTWADPGQNYERLGRYFKMFTDRHEVQHTIDRVIIRRELKKPRVLPPAKPSF